MLTYVIGKYIFISIDYHNYVPSETANVLWMQPV